MKKGRPAHTLHALVRADRADAVRAAVFRHTSTIGVREVRIGKTALDREMRVVQVAGHDVAVKLARLDGELMNAQPEYEDVARVAALTGRPAKDVLAERRGRHRGALVDLTVVAVTFGTIFLVELPDKTFIAALVLSTRFRPLAVWVGVGLAFGVQTLLAVTAGALATLLPDTLLKTVALLIFLVGAFVLVRTAPGADEIEKEQEEEYAAKAAPTWPPGRS